MNVVKGASGDVRGVLSACGDAFLSIATSGAVRPVVHMMTGFGQDCTRTRPRRPSAIRRYRCPHSGCRARVGKNRQDDQARRSLVVNRAVRNVEGAVRFCRNRSGIAHILEQAYKEVLQWSRSLAMKVVGKIESLWRYPVKSMRGEELQEAFVGFPGVYGDRLYAFRSSGAPKGFPYLTGREQEAMLLYRPTYRHPEHATRPENLSEAEAMGPGLTPVYADLYELTVDVETPAGERLPVDDPRLIGMLREGIRGTHELTLLRSDRAMTDCRPVSMISIQTARQVCKE